jgi:transposase
VIEVNAPDKATRRRRGKTDTLDAEAAARAVLSGRVVCVKDLGRFLVVVAVRLPSGSGGR